MAGENYIAKESTLLDVKTNTENILTSTGSVSSKIDAVQGTLNDISQNSSGGGIDVHESGALNGARIFSIDSSVCNSTLCFDQYGVLHVFGGETSTGIKNTHNYVRLFNGPKSTLSSKTPNMPYFVKSGPAVLYENEIHILGNIHPDGTLSSATRKHFKYNVDTNTFSDVATLPSSNFYCYNCRACVHNGFIYWHDGSNLYKYSKATGWVSIAKPNSVYYGSPICSANGSLYFFSGSMIYVYNESLNSWSYYTSSSRTITNGEAVSKYGKIFIYGGDGGNTGYSCCDLSDFTWTNFGNLAYIVSSFSTFATYNGFTCYTVCNPFSETSHIYIADIYRNFFLPKDTVVYCKDGLSLPKTTDGYYKVDSDTVIKVPIYVDGNNVQHLLGSVTLSR